MSGQRLITGGADRPLLNALRHAISHATEIDIAVSFIKVSGLELIFKDIETALLSERQVRLRLLTSDYLCVTDPRALRKLMLLAERGPIFVFSRLAPRTVSTSKPIFSFAPNRASL